MEKPKKKPKSYSKKELNKIRKQTGACEHDHVNYKSLEIINERLWERFKKDGNSLAELVTSNHKLSDALNRKTRQMVTWQKAGKRNSKLMNEREKEWEFRLEAVTKAAVDWRRKYQSLYGLKEFAESEGIDTDNVELTEEEKKVKDNYSYDHSVTQLESGKLRTSIKLTPKVKPQKGEGHFYFGKWIPGKKLKKPNGDGSK